MTRLTPLLLQLCLWTQLQCCTEAFRIYRPRATLLNRVASGKNVEEERLFMDQCEHSGDDGKCYRALDGDPFKAWTQCTATTASQNSEWVGYLEAPSYITRVVVHTVELPQSDMINALTDFEIQVSGAVCYRHVSDEVFEIRSFPCDSLGETVRLKSHVKSGYMALCEIEVFGMPISFQGLENSPIEITNQNCEQSSVESADMTCQRATDRNFNQNAGVSAKVCSRTLAEDDPWWASYFQVPALVTYVKLFLSLAHTRDMADSVVVKANGSPCGPDTQAGYRREDQPIFNCGGRLSSYFRVTNKKQSSQLTLCQAQAFGFPMILGTDASIDNLGCFRDNKDDPDLELLVSTTWMSPQKCHRMCKRRGKSKFGLQNGSMCFCGDKHGKHGVSEACDMPCREDSETMCGGREANSVYQIFS